MSGLVIYNTSPSLTDSLWILSGADATQCLRGINRFLRRKNPWGWRIFRTLKLGTNIKDVPSYCKAADDSRVGIGSFAADLLTSPEFKLTVGEVEIDLVVMSVADLGFDDGARYDKICEAAKNLGIEKCPPDVGPRLRLQYADQPLGDQLVICMDPIKHSDGELGIFYLYRNDSGHWLGSCCGEPDISWPGHSQWVFALGCRQSPHCSL